MDTARAVNATLDIITEALQSGSDVRLAGFGSFNVVARPASKARNPRTGEEIEVGPSNQPKFKASKVLKDALN